MPIVRHILDIDDLSQQNIQSILDQARLFQSGQVPSFAAQPVCVLGVFLEPSTRTKTSFALAANKLGFQWVDFGSSGQTSQKKGESLRDTLSNLAAMNPDYLIIRLPDGVSTDVLAEFKGGVISGGVGTHSHPTQAFADALTILSRHPKLDKIKVCYYGDVEHSRVFSSGAKLFSGLGCEVKYCSPYGLSSDPENFKAIPSMKEALGWGDVHVFLRIQRERMSAEKQSLWSEEIINNYRLDLKKAGLLKPGAMVMHPGPVNWGVELQEEILTLKDQCFILNQTQNGVFVRMAMLDFLHKGLKGAEFV